MIILRKIKSLKFAYFGFDNAAEDSDSSWQNDWLEKENLPSLVSIDVELANGEVWPQLVVSLKVDTAFGESGNRNSKPDSYFGIVGGKFVNVDENE